MGFTVPDKNAARWEKIGFSVNANANLNFYVLFQSLQCRSGRIKQLH